MRILKNKQALAILAVIFIAIVLAIFIIRKEAPQSSHHEHAHDGATDPRPKHGEPGHNHETDHLPLSQETAPHDHHAHQAQAEEIPKGPHGGKFFQQDDYAVEVTIYEQNTSPEFRVYTYQNNQALKPVDSNINIRLKRLGAPAQDIAFTPENDYLRGDAIIAEPHSFEVSITAQHLQKTYHFSYEQVEARVHMSARQLTINGIEVLTAGPATIQTTLKLQGEIKFNGDKTVQVVPRVGGIVASVLANAGDKVSKGQVLATISSQTIADMRSDLLAAQQQAALARGTYEREKQLWQDKISAKQDYLQAQHDLREAEINLQRIRQKLDAIGTSSTKNGLALYAIRAPIAGVVTQKALSLGQVVSSTSSIFQVSDLSSVWAEMVIYAKNINAVKVGQKVTVKAVAFNHESVGTITYVSPLIGEQSRTAMARVMLDNTDSAWFPGLPVNIELVADEAAVPLAVSTEAIQTLRDWQVVFGRYGEYFEARPVEFGRRDGRYAEVLNGLNPGDQYAAGNSFLIKADIGKAGATHDH